MNNQQAGALSREKSLLERYALLRNPVGASLSGGPERLYFKPFKRA
ncbi:hypothetical protein ABL850_07685 [Variovorax paradoxus]